MIDIPDIRQGKSYDCGKACAAAVLHLFGKPKARIEALAVSSIDGTDPRSLESFFRSCGFRVTSGEMDLDDLRRFTAKGRPVICTVKGHYVVVAGVTRTLVSYQDPEWGLQKRPLAAFHDWWIDLDRLGVHYRQFGMAVWE